MLMLPTDDQGLAPYALHGTPLTPRAPGIPLTRTAFAAAHVVSDPLRDRNPWDTRPAVDWDATLRFRETLWDQGLHLAEAMDTAQRGAGVDWPTALELIQRTMQAAKAHPMRPRVACGAGTDHLPLSELRDADAILNAYEAQAEAIEAAGGQLILMASRAFPAIGADAATYRNVYRRLIDGAAQPLIQLELLRNRALCRNLVSMGLVTTILMATLVVGPFFLTDALHFGPMETGLVMTIGPISPPFVSAVSSTCEWYIHIVELPSIGPGPARSFFLWHR